MSAPAKTIRVFLSSTFRDFQAERAYLHEVIFPEVRALFEKQGVSIAVVDPCLGLSSEEEAESPATLAKSVEGIDQCRPYFLSLVGELYGKILEPLPEEIRAKHEIFTVVPSASRTHCEIFYALATNDKEKADSFFFYFRKPDFLSRLTEAERAPFLSGNPLGHTRLHKLKQAIQSWRLPVRHYDCQWDGKEVSGLEEFGRLVFVDLLARVMGPALTASVPGKEPPTPVEERLSWLPVENLLPYPTGSGKGSGSVRYSRIDKPAPSGTPLPPEPKDWPIKDLEAYLTGLLNHWSPRSSEFVTDLVPQTLARALEKRSQFHGTTLEDLKTWLAAILKDSIANEFRQLRKDEDLPSFFGEEDYDHSVALDKALEKPVRLDENVQFTVYRPKAIQPEKWYTMLAFAHLSERPVDAPADVPDPIAEVKKRAEKVLENIETYQPVTQDSLQAVPREGEITLLPEIPGITFNPPRRAFLWQETVHQEEFRLRASAKLDGTIARGRLSVFLGSILLADVPLAIRVTHELEPATKTPMEGSTARPYRKIFASYSHKDLAIVEQVEKHAKAMGDEYLRDWIHLRTGQVWNDRLKELINEADIFQLFWSTNSMSSRFVRQEWEHALSLNRAHFIRPTYWEEPLPASSTEKLPPEELLRLHFQRINLGGPPDETARIMGPKPTGPVPVVPRGMLPPLPSGEATLVLTPAETPKPPEVPGYTIEGVLGKGGLGVVYKAQQQGLGRQVALKMTRLPDPETGPRFRAEIEMLAAADHPNILPIHDLFVTGDQRVQVTELVQGGSLDKHIADYVQDPRASARLVCQVARAIAFAHQKGILHRDLKPANILFREGKEIPADRRTALVADFGLAKASTNLSGRTESGIILGTPSYMAPEQAMGKVTTTATDVYSLGAILYELLTGRRPFQGLTPVDILQQVIHSEPQPPRAINPRVDRDLETICLKCLRKDPQKRYPSAQALAEDLGHWLQGMPILARPVSNRDRLLKAIRRQPIQATMVGLGILITLILFGIILFASR